MSEYGRRPGGAYGDIAQVIEVPMVEANRMMTEGWRLLQIVTIKQERQEPISEQMAADGFLPAIFVEKVITYVLGRPHRAATPRPAQGDRIEGENTRITGGAIG